MPLPPSTRGGAGSPGVLVVDYLKVLYRRRWLALGVLLAVVAAVSVYTFRAVPLYEAQVSVLIDFEEPQVIGFRQVLNESPGLGAYSQTQQELIVSRALVQRTVAAMQIWKRPGFGITSEDAAVSAIRGRLQVQPIRGTRMVAVRLRWTDPALAAEIVNEHARQYVEESLERRFRAAHEATEWLDTQLAEERRRVEASDAALQAFREQHDALSLEDDQNIVVQELTDLNAAVTRAKTARIEKEAQYREVLAAQRASATLEAFPQILTNGFVEQLKGSLAGMQREYAQLSETLGERHPTMIEKRTAIETTERRLAAEVARIVESLNKAYQAAAAEEASLTRVLEEQKREALALDRRGIEYAALEREAESNRLVYQTLLQRARETSVSQQLRATNIQIIDPARRPGAPVFPRTRFNLVMSVITGGLLAVVVAFLVEMLDDRLRSPADVVAHLPAPFLGLVPEVSSKETRRASLARREAPRVLVEAFRGLRTSVVASAGSDAPSHTLLIASASQREGKTHVASNLAISLAQARQRVLLVDADLRRPRVHEQLGHRMEPGLSDLLTGTAALNDTLQQASVPGLTVLPAGQRSDQAPELLGSDAFGDLLRILQEHFPWVIIDSPPAATVTDASVIAARGTMVVFVVASGMTNSRAARLALGALQAAGGRVLGTVLNRADLAHHPFYFAPYSYDDYLTSLGPADPAPAGPPTILGRRA